LTEYLLNRIFVRLRVLVTNPRGHSLVHIFEQFETSPESLLHGLFAGAQDALSVDFAGQLFNGFHAHWLSVLGSLTFSIK
jgi:hypothetical protein